MKSRSFSWDAYFATAPYAEVRKNSPDLSSRRYPTTYSPDRAWIYLSSQDLDFKTDDEMGLKSALSALSDAYQAARQTANQSKLLLIRIDHAEVCSLLQSLVECPEDYADPNSLLDGAP